MGTPRTILNAGDRVINNSDKVPTPVELTSGIGTQEPNMEDPGSRYRSRI